MPGQAMSGASLGAPLTQASGHYANEHWLQVPVPAPCAGAQLTSACLPCPCHGLPAGCVQGMLPIPAVDLVSPIFTMWLTLLLLYAANCLADYSAAATLNAAYTADLRRGEWGAGQCRTGK